MNTKRIFAVLLCMLSLLFLMTVDSFAAHEEDYKQIYNKINEDGQALLKESGISDVDFEELLSLSPKKVFTAIIGIAKGSYKQPLTAFITLMGLFIVASLVKNMSESLSEKNDIFSLFETAFTLSVISVPLSEAISSAVSAVKTVADFMLAYIPVFTGIISASGQPITSFAYSSVVLAFAEILVKGTDVFIIPLISVMTCLNVYSSLNGRLDLSKITSAVKKTITVALSVAATVFVGLINIKGNLATSADSLAIKGVKAASGSVIPIIGGVMGDALGAVLGSFSLIKSVFGVFGIIAVAVTVLPSIIELLLWFFFLSFSSAVCSSFDNGVCARVLETVCSMISIINTFLIFVATVFILTTGTVLSLRS